MYILIRQTQKWLSPTKLRCALIFEWREYIPIYPIRLVWSAELFFLNPMSFLWNWPKLYKIPIQFNLWSKQLLVSKFPLPPSIQKLYQNIRGFQKLRKVRKTGFVDQGKIGRPVTIEGGKLYLFREIIMNAFLFCFFFCGGFGALPWRPGLACCSNEIYFAMKSRCRYNLWTSWAV